MTPDPEDWYTVEVRTKHPSVGSLAAIVRYRDYDGQVMENHVLRVILHDRGEVHLYAPGEWVHFIAKPAPADVAEAAEAAAQQEES